MTDQKETTINDTEDNFDDIDEAMFDGGNTPEDIATETKVEVAPEVKVDPSAEKTAEKIPSEAPKGEDVTEAKPEGADATQAAEKTVEDEPKADAQGMMPYGAYAAEKSKRQAEEEARNAAEVENNRLKAEMALLQQQLPQAKEPDMYEDPAAYEQRVQKRAEDVHYQSMLNTAKLVAPSIVPQDEIAAAEAFFASTGIPADRLDAANRDALSKGLNPVVELVNWHKGEQQKIAFAEWQKSQQQPAAAQPAPTAQPQPTAQPAVNLPPNVAGVAPAATTAESFQSLDDIDAKLFG